jgi:tetratricopeptide (TPR) repeat protein
VSEALNQQIGRLEAVYQSELDPQGRAFVPLADAHRRLGDLDKALAILQKGLEAHPGFASAHMVAGWLHRSMRAPDEAMLSFKRVLELDADNSVAKAAIAELIDDQRAQAYRHKMAAKKAAEEAAAEEVPSDPDDVFPEETVISLGVDAPVAADETIASSAPEISVGLDVEGASGPHVDPRPIVPIASLAPQVADEMGAAPVAPEAAPHVELRPVVPIASLAPEDSNEMARVGDATAGPATDGDDRAVLPIPALAPDVDEDGSHADLPGGDVPGDGKIYTETLAELYAGQGATQQAIEVYHKLIAADPDNQALRQRLSYLESLEPGSDANPAPLDIRAGLGTLPGAPPERQTVPIASLAPN